MPQAMDSTEAEAVAHGDVVERDDGKGAKMELDYCCMLNRALPDEIRVVAWAPAPVCVYLII